MPSIPLPHTKDSDCEVSGLTHSCIHCHVYHGDACPECGQRGFHHDLCTTALLHVDPNSMTPLQLIVMYRMYARELRECHNPKRYGYEMSPSFQQGLIAGFREAEAPIRELIAKLDASTLAKAVADHAEYINAQGATPRVGAGGEYTPEADGARDPRNDRPSCDDDTQHECANCGNLWDRSFLEPISDLDQRVSPGEPIPSGQCPTCGALCHPLEVE